MNLQPRPKTRRYTSSVSRKVTPNDLQPTEVRHSTQITAIRSGDNMKPLKTEIRGLRPTSDTRRAPNGGTMTRYYDDNGKVTKVRYKIPKRK